jgi:cysteine synthase A
MSRILDSVLEAVGQTPLVRLGGINDTGKEILVKLEYLNPSGSIKDRVAVQTLNDLEAQGRLKS